METFLSFLIASAVLLLTAYRSWEARLGQEWEREPITFQRYLGHHATQYLFVWALLILFTYMLIGPESSLNWKKAVYTECLPTTQSQK